ncbi:MAG: type I glutamate--ammonia ligase [Alphaproteobacteria bacterium GM202ARS2]|nr:type I glutamate--ammonia ligase [Alphaproteobacteria bacterium GM202ARS2]
MSVKKVLDQLKEKDIKFVDLRFTDLRGKWQHTTQSADTITEEAFEEGIMFDGSSIAGWKDINESDMILKMDSEATFVDPFSAQQSLVIFCDVLEPSTGQPYSRDPRSISKAAEAYLKSAGVGDTAYFGPEAEFFIFDDVRIKTDMNHMMYHFNSEEGPYASGDTIEGGNMAHRPGIKGGYFPVPPVDSMADMRAEMITVMNEIGMTAQKHHHEVAPSQNELGFDFGTLAKTADALQMYKYVVHMVAHSYGKTATFMPKPVVDDNGSGMHVHQSVWKGGKPLFAGSGYADLSETCLHYIGGLMKHARALNAFTNPTTNSYKRLVPGFEAPVLLAYSSRNRSASFRIPYSASAKGKRIEARFPDPAANPYLAFAALLMAGIDGIENRINPGDAMDKNLYDLPPQQLSNIPTVCASLDEALDALEQDRDFLKKGDVFTDDIIDAYCGLKRQECQELNMTPHPVEFKMYYSI